ncbi:MAG: hypothetical protein ACR2IF_15230 [Terriglobales bacterium]
MRAIAVVVALLVLGASICSATTVIPMSVEELTAAATQVIEARAVSSRSAWNAEHTLIFTYTTFEVQRALKGAASPTITVKQLGGSAEGYTQKVAGVRYAQTGEQTVLFLRPSAAADGTFVVVGLMQGHFRVYQSGDGSVLATNGVTASTMLEENSTQVTTRAARMPIRLSDLESRVLRGQQ